MLRPSRALRSTSLVLRLSRHTPNQLQIWRFVELWPRDLSRKAQMRYTGYLGSTRFMSTQIVPPFISMSNHVVEVIDEHGQKKMRTLSPSYPDKPEAIANLLKNLSTINLLERFDEVTYKSSGWELNNPGNLISRFAAFNSEQDLRHARNEINATASELNHHPTIFTDTSTKTSIPYMLIACTTHHPPGLSVKDAKLAKRVDEILERIGQRNDSKNEELNAAEVQADRRKARAYVETKIAEDCACADSHEK